MPAPLEGGIQRWRGHGGLRGAHTLRGKLTSSREARTEREGKWHLGQREHFPPALTVPLVSSEPSLQILLMLLGHSGILDTLLNPNNTSMYTGFAKGIQGKWWPWHWAHTAVLTSSPSSLRGRLSPSATWRVGRLLMNEGDWVLNLRRAIAHGTKNSGSNSISAKV